MTYSNPNMGHDFDNVNHLYQFCHSTHCNRGGELLNIVSHQYLFKQAVCISKTSIITSLWALYTKIKNNEKLEKKLIRLSDLFQSQYGSRFWQRQSFNINSVIQLIVIEKGSYSIVSVINTYLNKLCVYREQVLIPASGRCIHEETKMERVDQEYLRGNYTAVTDL